jgi:hypothetical protein
MNKYGTYMSSDVMVSGKKQSEGKIKKTKICTINITNPPRAKVSNSYLIFSKFKRDICKKKNHWTMTK